MKTHVVKALPVYFEGYVDGSKPWSLRKNDRDYQDGDVFYVQEEGRNGDLTGRNSPFIIVKVWRNLEPHVAPGYVILTLAEPSKTVDEGGELE